MITKPILYLALTGLFLAACASRPQRLCPECQPGQLNPVEPYPLNIWQHNLRPGVQQVHVYLEGDGIPWYITQQPARNPSSRDLTALRLMALDSAPAVYLNRPCYGYKDMPTNCNSALWTSDRYSPVVVNTMNQALTAFKQQQHNKNFVLIGHSGGGTLAMLLAAERDDVSAVVTLAANLDHQQWTALKHYRPLTGSLNAVEAAVPAETLRWHFAGGKDQQVPAEIVVAAAGKDPHAKVFLHEEFDHSCCWESVWPDILQQLQEALAAD